MELVWALDSRSVDGIILSHWVYGGSTDPRPVLEPQDVRYTAVIAGLSLDHLPKMIGRVLVFAGALEGSISHSLDSQAGRLERQWSY